MERSGVKTHFNATANSLSSMFLVASRTEQASREALEKTMLWAKERAGPSGQVPLGELLSVLQGGLDHVNQAIAGSAVQDDRVPSPFAPERSSLRAYPVYGEPTPRPARDAQMDFDDAAGPSFSRDGEHGHAMGALRERSDMATQGDAKRMRGVAWSAGMDR